MKRLAVIQIRGLINTPKEVKDTLKMLHLTRANHCVVIDDRPTYIGMLKKVTPWVTWGEIDKDTFEAMLRKRGRLVGDKKLTDDYVKENTKFANISEFVDAFMNFEAELEDIPNLKPVFRLTPPSGGYKSIKKHWKEGGDRGYRGEKINELIKRMI